MKSNIKILVILLTLIVSSVFTKQVSAQQNNISFQVFYDQLSPYGQWVDYPNYGYVWIPDAGSDFVPYSSNGHWIPTNYGWTWASDYNWGWAPFHYGRWDYDSYYGWFWVPDNEWGPAWVTWRRANGYYGWEPMQPGVSISLSFGREYNSNNNHWIFVRDMYFDRSDVSRYYVDRTSRDKIIRNSNVINNTYVDKSRNTTYVSGPKREDVQHFTGRKVNPVAVQENSRPGQNMSNGQLHIYRPQVTKNNEMGHKPAPSRIVNLKDVKRPSERNAPNKPQTVNQPQKVNQPQTVNQPQRVNQPQKVNQPQRVNQPQKVNQPQTINKSDNNRQEPQTNTASPQRSNNNSRVPEQQNANSSQNNRSEKQPVTVKPSVKNKNVQQKKSSSEPAGGKTK